MNDRIMMKPINCKNNLNNMHLNKVICGEYINEEIGVIIVTKMQNLCHTENSEGI